MIESTVRSRPALSDGSMIASIIWFSCSMRVCLGILDPHLCSQVFNRAKLQLLYRPFRATKLQGDLADGLVFAKTHSDDATLIVRELVHQRKQPGASFGLVQNGI